MYHTSILNYSMTSLSSLQKILAALILLVIVFFSLFHITESPPFGFDEGWAFHLATNISRVGESVTQFSPGHLERSSIISVGYPLLYPLAFWFKLFGGGILQARLMMVLYMFGFVFVSFTFLRRIYGNAIALSSIALLSTFPPFYTFGKEIIGEVPVLFFFVLSLLCLHLAFGNPRRKLFWLIMAGFSVGLCVASKTMALALIPVLFVGAFLAFRKGLATWKDIGIVAVSTLLPIVVWVFTNFAPGDTLASILNYYTNPSVLTNKTSTFFVNLRMFFSGIGPLFVLSFIGIWTVGLWLRLQARAKILVEEYLAFLFALVLMFSLLFRYWDARYYFPIQVLGILFAPASLFYILQRTKIFPIGILLLSVLGLYQLSYHSYIADSYTSTLTAGMSEFFAKVPDSTSVFFYNTPQALAFFHGTNYYQRTAIFEKWGLGSEYATIAREGRVDLRVLGPPMLEADATLPLDKYVEVAKFREIRILKKKAAR